MGIPRLHQLVYSREGVLRDELFRAERLVIDGSGLVYHLYRDQNLDQKFGGDYDAFKDQIEQFIGALRRCDIRPYVVFDGCADFPDLKWETEKQRAELRLKQAHDVATKGKKPSTVLPTLVWEVFRQTLTELRVPLARCYTEADQQVAALAQEWDCPVLSSDGDFFIFPLTRGMLHNAHFRWQEVQQLEGQSFIPCKTYLSSRFCEDFSIQPLLLPVFAALAGNDYTRNRERAGDMTFGIQSNQRLKELLQKISHAKRPKMLLAFGLSQRISMDPNGVKVEATKLFHGHKQRPDSGFEDADPQKVFEEFLKDVSQEEREQRVNDLQKAANHYSLPPSSLRDFISAVPPQPQPVPPLPPQMVELVPDWMRRPVTEARFSSDFLDVLTNQRVGLSVAVDHMDKPSANQVSLPLRRVLYELLLGRGRTVEERDRDGREVIFTKVPTDSSVSPQLSLQSLPQTALEQRRQVLLNALGVSEQSLSSLPSHLSDLALPLAATRFWLKEATPPPDPSLLKALLIGWCRGDTLRKNADSKWFLNHHWCNLLNQWQSCLKDSFLLNQLLGAPLPEPPMARLYNGSLVYTLLNKMRSGLLDQSYIQDIDFRALLSMAQQ